MRDIQKNTRAGFSLAELLIAFAVLSIISYLVVPRVMNQFEDAKRKTTALTLKTKLRSGIQQYYVDISKLPDRLNDLVKPPFDEGARKKWRQGGYLDTDVVPVDAWGNDYGYRPTPGGKHEYELWSYGKGGKGAPEKDWISVWD